MLLKFCIPKRGEIYPAYVSRHNSNREKQVILLMIPNGERWHYLAIKELSALLKSIAWKRVSDIYCLNYLHSFRTKNKLDLHNKVYKNKDFWDAVIPSQDTKILEFNQYQNSAKTPFIIYTDL